MNKVITINLGGTAYQLEEGGYDTLRSYLETAAARLQGNPDREEILTDIEWAMAEKFRALLGSHKTVVVTKEVAAVLAEMGPIEAAPGEAPTSGESGAGAPPGGSGPGPAQAESAPPGGGKPKRLYRLYDGAQISGVCNGLAAYLNIDPTLVRLGFVLLTLFWGTGLLVYVVMAIVVPEARSPEEKAAASGDPSTAQEFIRRAKAGYYEAVKGFPDRQAHREWKRRFKRDMRAHSYRWRHQWQGYWAEHFPVHPGMAAMLPIFSLLHGGVKIFWLCALVSFLATGALFGAALPENVPVWVAVLVLVIIYGMLTLPLKAARRVCSGGLGQARPLWSVVFLMDAVVWLGVVAVLLWLAFHYFPEVRQAIQAVPTVAHQAADDIQTWWQRK